MRRSARPSPFTSPAPETLAPERSPAALPRIAKPPQARLHVRELDGLAAGLPEDDVALPGTRSAAGRGRERADEEVREPVAVHIPRPETL
jgi:hypothetical protein